MPETPREQLRDAHPEIFGHMRFPFLFEDGWLPIVAALADVMAAHAAATGRPPPRASQIKEKFGGLRFYATGVDAFDDGAIRMACEFADRLSEMSGRPGLPLAEGGWHRTAVPDEAPKATIAAPCEDWIASCGPGESLRRLRAAHPAIGFDIPAGWSDLTAALVLRLGTPVKPLALTPSARGVLLTVRVAGEGAASVPGIVPSCLRVGPDGALMAELPGAVSDHQVGTLAFAAAMSRRLDRETGVAVL